MSLELPKTHLADTEASLSTRNIKPWSSRLLSIFAETWEIYLILLIAGFLYLYQINTTEFDHDQAILFRMAYDALHHGLLPSTSDTASINIVHPPGVIYLFMLPAALSADPLWAAVMVALFNAAAVLLTYLFTRRYYGRLAGIIAALLYGAASKPLNYARFIWQPNMMAPLVILFIFVLFWGLLERRKGWLVPALFLLGVLYQLHETAFLLAAPLLMTLVLAPGTFRWRDLALAFGLLLVIFFPYLLWEVFTGFADVHTVFLLAKQPAHIDIQAIHFYRLFLRPYDKLPTDMHSAVRMLAPILSWLSIVVPLLTLGGFVTAGMLVLRARDARMGEFPGRSQAGVINRGRDKSATTMHEESVPPPQESTGVRSRSIVGAGIPIPQIGCPALFAPALQWGWVWRVRNWWTDLRSSPYRCGLMVLLIWQIAPLLSLSRHTIGLHAQYFFVLMPGPFILIGLSVSKVIEWFQVRGQSWNTLRYGAYAMISLVIIAQLVGGTASVIDTSSGYFDDRSFQPYPYHNDLRSMQHALSEADQLAQQRHLSRIYITTDTATQTALRYLAERMQTPTTLFDAATCLVLPNPAYGPAVFLVGPYDGLTNALLSQFASAALVDSPMRLGGAPYRLYIVTPTMVRSSSSSAFTGDLQLFDTRVQGLNYSGSSWLVTRWSLLRPEQPSYRTTYSYAMTAMLGGAGQQSRRNVCTFTAIQAGDQLLVAFSLPRGSRIPISVIIKAQSFMTLPDNPYYGPFHLETGGDRSTTAIRLHTVGGSDSITLSGTLPQVH
jgi:hypothetical protein